MDRYLMGGVAAWALTAGCKFPELPPIDDDAALDAQVIDAPIDATPTCIADSVDCDDATGIYTDCSTAGTIEVQIECPLGCAPGLETCLDIDPSNGLALCLDTVTDPPDVTLQGTTVIDTEAGTILSNGENVSPPRCVSGGMRAFVVRSLSVSGTVTVVHDYGNPALAFVATGDVMIAGLVDVSADFEQGGPAASWGGDQSGRKECTAGWAMTAPGGGGSGGAGGVDEGADGGAGTAMGGHLGGVQVTPLVPFVGGCEGGTTSVGTGDGPGGGGGGALQISSRTRIELRENGVIDASGGGGRLTTGSRRPGSGGGAGGNVILEAPQVVLDGSNVVISTKGGGGAGAGTGPTSNGADGGTEAMAAPGGNSTFQSHGGRGGTATQVPFPGEFAMGSNYEGGGGGGSVGMTRFATSAGVIQPVNGATVRSRHVEATLPTRTLP